MSKKKEKGLEVDPGPLVHDGWKVGQEVWCRLYPNEELATGKISRIYLEDSEPCFTLADKFTGSFRLALFSTIIPVPSAAMQNKLVQTHVREKAKMERAENRKEKRAQARRVQQRTK